MIQHLDVATNHATYCVPHIQLDALPAHADCADAKLHADGGAKLVLKAVVCELEQ